MTASTGVNGPLPAGDDTAETVAVDDVAAVDGIGGNSVDGDDPALVAPPPSAEKEIIDSAASALRLSYTQCYWAILDALPTRGRRESALAFAFEAVLPVPVETVQCAFVDMPNQRVLAVAIDQSVLRERLAACDVPPWRAGPDQLPAHMTETVSVAMVERCNFLTGPFESRRRRRFRWLVVALICGGFLVSAAMMGVRAQRATAAYDAATQAVQRRGDAMADAVAPVAGSGDQRSPRNRLTSEVRRARLAAATEGIPSDLVPVLQAFWRAWPATVRVQVEHIIVNEQRLEVRGRVADAAAADVLKGALEILRPIGHPVWQVQSFNLPLVNEQEARFVWVFVPQPEAGTGGAP